MTVNEQWLDALLRHQIFILRTSGALRNEVNELLNATELDIAAQIREALRIDPTQLSRRLRRAEALVKEIKKLRSMAWDEVDEKWITSMGEFVKGEVKFLKTAFETIVPVQISLKLPPAGTLRALTTTRPFQGRVLKEWARDVRLRDLKRIEDQIKIGIVQGESAPTIARRVVGTARLRGRDGVTQITRRNAEAISRTAIIHFSDAARGEFLAANAAFFEFELFVATLDSRTTPICRSLDGERFPLGTGPRPPLHWNCRSLRVASIGAEAIGMRPAKASTQRMLLREFTQQQGLGTVATRAKLPYGTKTKFDAFSRRRIRELTGQVPAKVTYQEWLKEQSAEFQDDVLGVTRGKLFRKGNVTLDRFVNRRGDEIPLAQLAEKEAAAFRAAGVNLEKFL